MPLSLWLWWFSVRWFLKQADFGLFLLLNGCRAVLKKTLVNATIIMIMVIQRSVISEASRSWIASSPKWLPSCAKKVATVTLQDHTFRVSSFSRFSNSTSNNMNAFRSAVGHRVGFFSFLHSTRAGLVCFTSTLLRRSLNRVICQTLLGSGFFSPSSLYFPARQRNHNGDKWWYIGFEIQSLAVILCPFKWWQKIRGNTFVFEYSRDFFAYWKRW